MFRSLSLLRRLQRGPADLAALAEWVQVEVDGRAYADLTVKARHKRLENDLTRLRDWGVEIAYAEGAYHLVSYGEFSPVALGEEELEAAAFVAESFGPGAPLADEVQRLLRTVADWLPTRQRDSMPMRRQRYRIDLRRTDSDVIAPAVERAIDRAIGERRLLEFHYISPSQADGVARVHVVQPWKLYFDSVRRHLYLDAYCLRVRGPYGLLKQERWRIYRLGRIQEEEIRVLPERMPPTPPKRPRYALEYWLAPDLVRLGEVTRLFAETELQETDANGWRRVTAQTDDLFRAVRQLLSYGPMCRVTGGPEAKQEMEALVTALAKLYSVPDSQAE
jgi:predicted DNA-binding transcriptional regulator YafY